MSACFGGQRSSFWLEEVRRGCRSGAGASGCSLSLLVLSLADMTSSLKAAASPPFRMVAAVCSSVSLVLGSVPLGLLYMVALQTV